MEVVTIKEGQTLFDIALQLYGDVSKVYQVIADNPEIESVNTKEIAGFEVKYTVQGNKVTEYYKKENLSITTGYPFEPSTAFMLQENGFYILQENGFKIIL
jgi:hypothetical protein